MARRKPKQAETEDDQKALARIDHLAEAVAERLSDADRARWTGLAVGLGFATLAGLIGLAIYLFLRKNEGGSQVTGVGLGDGQLPITIINQLPEYKPKKPKKSQELRDARESFEQGRLKVNSSDGLPLEVAQASAVNRDTTLRNIRLTGNAALRVMTAVGPNAWRVMLRVLGPPGGFAAFATDAARLRAMNSYMGDDVLIVPAGGVQEIVLNPRQVLYGMSSFQNLSVSVVGSEQIPSAAPQLSLVR